jgi:hypothetical protein
MGDSHEVSPALRAVHGWAGMQGILGGIIDHLVAERTVPVLRLIPEDRGR